MLKPVKIFWTFVRHGPGKLRHKYGYPQEIKPEANVSHLVSRLRVKINAEQRKLSQPEGPEGRLKLLRHTVTALFKYERIEATYNRVHEAQGYAERIIAEAIKHGDCHIATMEMADYWLLEKQLVHKLFKVLVPRFERSTRSYTRFYTAPRPYFGDGFYKPREDMHIDPEFAFKVHRPRAVLELRGNPYPPLLIPQVSNPRSLHNVLLWAAREEKRKLQVEESLREEGLLGKSAHLESVIAKSIARSRNRDILGEEQNQLNENIVKQSSVEPSSGNIPLRSELPGQELSGESVQESVVEVKSDSKAGYSTEPNKTS